MGRTDANMIVLHSSIGLPRFHPLLHSCEVIVSDEINQLHFWLI